jgi:O-antigen/teichoic acid export membrane protein
MPAFPPRWLRFLPASIRNRIQDSQNVQKIIGNVGWLFFDKVLRMGVGLFVGVWVARYLGPERFGIMSYGIAFVGLFSAIGTLGLNGIVVRDLVRNPADKDATLGTAFVLQTLGGLVGTILALVSIEYAKPDDEVLKIIVLILGTAMVFRASDIVKYWFESKVQSKVVVWIENGVFLFMTLVKVFLILNSESLLAFVYVFLVESFLVSSWLFYAYVADGQKIRNLRWQYQRACELLSDSWPLILSGLAVMMYMRIDQIMLGGMLSSEKVGIYAAAARISEVWYFFPTVIVNSLFPSIVDLKKRNDPRYLPTIQLLYDYLISVSLLVALVMTFMSPWVVRSLYGDGYAEAGQVLSIQIWAGVFVTMGIARGPWVLSEGLQRYTHRYIIIALIVNLVANYVLIPIYGLVGAAIGSVMAQATTAVIAPCLFKETRPAVKMFATSLNPMRWAKKLFMGWWA